MSKLLQRLSDASRSGVYRASSRAAIDEATQGSDLQVTRIDLEGVRHKDALLGKIAGALRFPEWFGGNWDALEDCLTDLSWSRGRGQVLVLEGTASLPNDERGILADVLASAAAYWAEQQRPFFAVFVGGEASLPPLFRERN